MCHLHADEVVLSRPLNVRQRRVSPPTARHLRFCRRQAIRADMTVTLDVGSLRVPKTTAKSRTNAVAVGTFMRVVFLKLQRSDRCDDSPTTLADLRVLA